MCQDWLLVLFPELQRVLVKDGEKPKACLLGGEGLPFRTDRFREAPGMLGFAFSGSQGEQLAGASV